MTVSQTNSSTSGCILILVLCPLLTNCPAVDRVNGSRFIAPCFIWLCSAAPTMFVAFKGVYTPEWTHSPQGSVYPTTPPTPITHVLIAPPPHLGGAEVIKLVWWCTTGGLGWWYQLAYCHCSSHPRLNQAAPLIRRCSWCPRNSLLSIQNKAISQPFSGYSGW